MPCDGGRAGTTHTPESILARHGPGGAAILRPRRPRREISRDRREVGAPAHGSKRGVNRFSRRGAAADQQATGPTTPNVARLRGTGKAGVKPVRPPDPVLARCTSAATASSRPTVGKHGQSPTIALRVGDARARRLVCHGCDHPQAGGRDRAPSKGRPLESTCRCSLTSGSRSAPCCWIRSRGEVLPGRSGAAESAGCS
jgi:hypothetical protein